MCVQSPVENIIYCVAPALEEWQPKRAPRNGEGREHGIPRYPSCYMDKTKIADARPNLPRSTECNTTVGIEIVGICMTSSLARFSSLVISGTEACDSSMQYNPKRKRP